jgi:hypothetical protein
MHYLTGEKELLKKVPSRPSSVEAWSNTSTVTLRVVGGNQKGRDSDPRKTALARPSSIYKRPTLLSSERALHKIEDRNCQTIINIWS